MSAGNSFPSKTAQTLLWFAGFAVSLALLPGLIMASNDERDSRWGDLWATARETFYPQQGSGPPELPAVLSAGVTDPPAPEPRAKGAPRRLEGPLLEAEHPLEENGDTLDAFYAALAKTKARGGQGPLTRVIHYGDSMLTGDGISNAVRQELQEYFGNGGHGFVLAGRPWLWYRHQGMASWNSPGFRVNRITANPLPDGRFGLGCVSFRSFQGGARFFVEPEEGELVSSYELYYLAQPRGGDLLLQVDGLADTTITTKSDTTVSRTHRLELPTSAKRLTVTYAGGGEVRVFGVAAEREGPGIVWDSLGVNGLHASNFDRFDRQHIARQIQLRDPALIVVMLGTNESQNPNLNLERHAADYRQMLELLRSGAPEASCLILSPPDRALTRRRGQRSLIARIVDAQRGVAREQGCAFWSTFDAMGGEGSAAEWRRRRPPLMGGDLTHPTPAGAEFIGTHIAEAIVAGYQRWQRRHASPPAR